MIIYHYPPPIFEKNQPSSIVFSADGTSIGFVIFSSRTSGSSVAKSFFGSSGIGVSSSSTTSSNFDPWTCGGSRRQNDEYFTDFIDLDRNWVK